MSLTKDTQERANALVEEIRKRKKQHKAEKAPTEIGVEPNLRPNNISTCGVRPTARAEECNPATGAFVRTYEITTLASQVQELDETYTTLKKALATVIELQDKDGNRFSLHPASCYEIEGFDKNKALTEHINSALMLNPDSPVNEELKQSLNTFRYSPALLSIMTVNCGVLVFSPTEFLGVPARLYGMRPLFVRLKITERMAIKIVIDFIVMHVSKSRIVDQMKLQWGNLGLSKQQVISLINGVCRMLSPLAQYMRRILLEQSETMHNDDCTMQCLEYQINEDGQRVRHHCNLWGMVTGAHEEIQGAMFLAAESRSVDEFLKQFGYTKEDETEIIFPCGLKNFVTDCCNVYIPGIEKIEQLTGRKVVRGGCYAHLRRYFIEAMESLNIWAVYDAVCGNEVGGFEERVECELAARGIEVGPFGRKVMLACFLTEVIFWLEADFEFTDRATMEERRRTVTVFFVDKLYALIDELKAVTKSIELSGERDGVLQYKGGKDVPWGSAVVYALNNTKELHAFLYCGDIECSNNRAERCLRPGKAHSRSMLFLATITGFYGLAVLLTIYQTCRMNDINPYEYLHWFIENEKLRVEDFRLTTPKDKETTAQILKLPRPIKKDGKVINLYDDEYECPYDKIDLTGLDPWSYKALLRKESTRIKDEYRQPMTVDSVS